MRLISAGPAAKNHLMNYVNSLARYHFQDPDDLNLLNKLIQDELYKYIADKKVRVLGSPMPIDNESIDWENTEDFIFKYEVGLAPEFDVRITTRDKLDYYKIKVDPKLVESYCNDIEILRYGFQLNQPKNILMILKQFT